MSRSNAKISRPAQRFAFTAMAALGCALSGTTGASSLAAAEPSASSPALERFEYEEVQMGVGFKVVLYAGDREAANRASRKALDRVAALNAMLSDYVDESELNRLCRAFAKPAEGEPAPQPTPAVPVSAELFRVLSHAQQLSEKSHGAFDVSVGPLVKLWRRARRQKALPAEARLNEARQVVGYRHIRLDPQARTVRLEKLGMQLDLGGIAKGYAADEALAVLKSEGITRAIVAAAGDIAAGDPPPGETGWRVGIAPLDASAPPSRFLRLSNGACSTSGDAFQYVEIDGKRYSHLVDPQTGLGLVGRVSVTVVGADGIAVDSVASTACVLGPVEGMKLVESIPGLSALMVRVNDAGQVETLESAGWKKLTLER